MKACREWLFCSVATEAAGEVWTSKEKGEKLKTLGNMWLKGVNISYLLLLGVAIGGSRVEMGWELMDAQLLGVVAACCGQDDQCWPLVLGVWFI